MYIYMECKYDAQSQVPNGTPLPEVRGGTVEELGVAGSLLGSATGVLGVSAVEIGGFVSCEEVDWSVCMGSTPSGGMVGVSVVVICDDDRAREGA